MQFWHRCRAARPFPRIRNWTITDAAKPLGFAGYKAGMTHALVMDKRPNSLTKNETISIPITIIECPPIRACGYITYTMTPTGKARHGQVMALKQEKHLDRAMNLAKTATEPQHPVPQGLCDVTLLVHTQPHTAGIGKKTPEVFEIALGGKTVSEKLEAAKQLLGKDIAVSDVFTEGQQLDCHAVTKGYGYQGPVKRFGVALRSHKSEKGTRGPGNVGGWTGNRSWTVSHAGQTGYHTRTEYNKWLIKIGTNGKDATPVAGFHGYGVLKGPYILVKGSVAGPAKRLIRLITSRRPNLRIPKEAPKISTLGFNQNLSA